MNKKAFLCLLGLLSLLSCTDETFEITLGDKYVNSQTTVSMVDTLTVAMSTIKLDSVQTQSSDYFMSGSYTDEYFGDISATTYTQLEIPSASIDDDEVYDSIFVYLKYTGLYYGDTLQPQSISIHEVLEDIELPDEYDVDPYLYNTTTLKYDPTSLGSVTVTPRPNRDDTLKFKLSDELGERFLEYLRDDDDEIDDNDDFVDLFKGIAIVPGDENNSIFSFWADSMTIQVYTHVHEFYNTVNRYEFTVSSSINHFQHVESDVTGTGLETLTDQQESVSSGTLDKKAYVQGGTGYVTRLDFPSLEMLTEIGSKNILYQVSLILRPIKGIYDEDALPEELALYETDDRNEVGDQVLDSDSEGVTLTLYTDEDNNKAPYYYAADVTNYIYETLSDGFDETEDIGLLVMPPTSDLYGTLSNVILDARTGQSYRPELKLYYIFYE
jgi:hypothetical protein